MILKIISILVYK